MSIPKVFYNTYKKGKNWLKLCTAIVAIVCDIFKLHINR